MLRLLVVIAVVGLHVYALIDCVRTSPTHVRGLPFAAWVLVVLFVPVIGPMLWLWSGRPEAFDPVGRRRWREPGDLLQLVCSRQPSARPAPRSRPNTRL